MGTVFSIVIINYRNPPLLRLCLKSVIAALSTALPWEIIVIDSLSTPESRSVVEDEFNNPRISLIPFAENTGYTRGVNEGLSRANGDHILILNPDIVPLVGSIECLQEYLAQHPGVGLAGPRLLNFDGTPQHSCFRFVTPLTIAYRRIGYLPFARRILDRFLMKDADFSRPLFVDWLMGSAVMVTREALRNVGPMDTRLFHYMNDVDWARRFWENGYQVAYVPDARMYHYHRRDSKGRLGIFDILVKKETRWHVKDALRYFIKYRGRPFPIT